MNRTPLCPAPADPAIPGCIVDEHGYWYKPSAPADFTRPDGSTPIEPAFRVSGCCHAANSIDDTGSTYCKRCYTPQPDDVLCDPVLPAPPLAPLADTSPASLPTMFPLTVSDLTLEG